MKTHPINAWLAGVFFGTATALLLKDKVGLSTGYIFIAVTVAIYLTTIAVELTKLFITARSIFRGR